MPNNDTERLQHIKSIEGEIAVLQQQKERLVALSRITDDVDSQIQVLLKMRDRAHSDLGWKKEE